MKGLLKKSYAILLALGLGYASAILCPPERGPEAPHITAARQTVEAHQEHVNRLQEESRAMEARHAKERTALNTIKDLPLKPSNKDEIHNMNSAANTLGISFDPAIHNTAARKMTHIKNNLPTEDSLEKQHKRESAFANNRLSSALRDLSRSRNVLNSHLEQQAAAAPKRPGGLRRISDMLDAPSGFGTGQQQAPTAPKRPIGLRRISDMPDAPSGFDTSQQQAPESQWDQATGRRRTWKTVETPEYLEARRKAAEQINSDRTRRKADKSIAQRKTQLTDQERSTVQSLSTERLQSQAESIDSFLQNGRLTSSATPEALKRELNIDIQTRGKTKREINSEIMNKLSRRKRILNETLQARTTTSSEEFEQTGIPTGRETTPEEEEALQAEYNNFLEQQDAADRLAQQQEAELAGSGAGFEPSVTDEQQQQQSEFTGEEDSPLAGTGPVTDETIQNLQKEQQEELNKISQNLNELKAKISDKEFSAWDRFIRAVKRFFRDVLTKDWSKAGAIKWDMETEEEEYERRQFLGDINLTLEKLTSSEDSQQIINDFTQKFNLLKEKYKK